MVSRHYVGSRLKRTTRRGSRSTSRPCASGHIWNKPCRCSGREARPTPPANILLAAPTLRDSGDSFVAALMPVYVLALGFFTAGRRHRAGLAAGLVGAYHWYRVPWDHAGSSKAPYRRRLPDAGDGVAFAAIRDYALLLVVAFGGMIKPMPKSSPASLKHPPASRASPARVRDRCPEGEDPRRRASASPTARFRRKTPYPLLHLFRPRDRRAGSLRGSRPLAGRERPAPDPRRHLQRRPVRTTQGTWLWSAISQTEVDPPGETAWRFG